eukprot:13552700-Ditylum_brightwellii.AAC.1
MAGWMGIEKSIHGLVIIHFIENHLWRLPSHSWETTTLLCLAVHNSLGAILDPDLTQPHHAVEKLL